MRSSALFAGALTKLEGAEWRWHNKCRRGHFDGDRTHSARMQQRLANRAAGGGGSSGQAFVGNGNRIDAPGCRSYSLRHRQAGQEGNKDNQHTHRGLVNR